MKRITQPSLGHFLWYYASAIIRRSKRANRHQKVGVEGKTGAKKGNWRGEGISVGEKGEGARRGVWSEKEREGGKVWGGGREKVYTFRERRKRSMERVILLWTYCWLNTFQTQYRQCINKSRKLRERKMTKGPTQRPFSMNDQKQWSLLYPSFCNNNERLRCPIQIVKANQSFFKPRRRFQGVRD